MTMNHTPTPKVQACREEDRAMLRTKAGKQLIEAVVAVLARPNCATDRDWFADDEYVKSEAWGGIAMCHIPVTKDGIKEARLTADFIVSACNAHDALTARVAELEAALKLVAYGQKGISYAKAREQARAALAKGQA